MISFRKHFKCVENEGHGKERVPARRPSDGCARKARGLGPRCAQLPTHQKRAGSAEGGSGARAGSGGVDLKERRGGGWVSRQRKLELAAEIPLGARPAPCRALPPWDTSAGRPRWTRTSPGLPRALGPRTGAWAPTGRAEIRLRVQTLPMSLTVEPSSPQGG